jgi:hypothetical protein
MKKMFALLAVAAALCVSADCALAQQDNGGGGGGGGRRGGGGGFQQMDPQQRQQMQMDRYKQDLGITNDTDWSAIQPLVQKVADTQREAMMARFAGAFRRGGRGGGGGGGGFNAPTDPDREALQQAVDNNAPAGQVKAALDKYRAAQKAKEAKLEAAQADLKKVLSQKQEAAAVLAGLLN